MKKEALSLVFLIAIVFVLASLVVQTLASQQQTLLYDDFNDNQINLSIWVIDIVGNGNSVAEEDGVLKFTTYGHHGWQYGHALLNTTPVSLPSWSKITVQGDWMFLDPNTAEMTMKFYDCVSPGRYISVKYVSWQTDKISIKWSSGNGVQSYSTPRLIPQDSFAHYKLIVTRNGFEFWEDGEIVYYANTTGFSGITCVAYSIGGWDYSSLYSHMYYDNINISIEPLEAQDSTPPSTISGLTHRVTPEMIKWTWQNPADPDFKDALVYINGTFMGATSEENWIIENPVPGDFYTIGVLTEDQTGNINNTWVNDTVRALIPSYTVYVNTTGWWYPGQEFVSSEQPLNDAVKAVLPEGSVIILSGVYQESIPLFKPLTIQGMGGIIAGDGSQFDENLPERPVIFADPGEGNITLIGIIVNSTVSNTGIIAESGVLNIINTTVILNGVEGYPRGVVSINTETRIESLYLNITAPNAVGVLFDGSQEGSLIKNSYVRVHGDGSIGVYSYSSSPLISNNTIYVTGFSEKIGYALEITDSPLSRVFNNTFITNSSNPSAYSLIVSGESLWETGINKYNSTPIKVKCMGNCILRTATLPLGTSFPENMSYTGITIHAAPDTWMILEIHYDETLLQGLPEESLELWELKEAWSKNDIANQTLDIEGNYIAANITGEALYSILGSEQARPPQIVFVPPTPQNETLSDNRFLYVNVTSDTPLEQAFLKINGSTVIMDGSGDNWHLNYTLVRDGAFSFQVQGVSSEGVAGLSETRIIYLDTTPPVLLSYGMNASEVYAGEPVILYSYWTDPHLSRIEVWGNITGYETSHLIAQKEASLRSEWMNITASTTDRVPGNYCWYAIAYDELNHQAMTQPMCLEVKEPLRILFVSPQNNTPAVWDNSTLIFNITFNKPANITWLVNNTVVKQDKNTVESSFALAKPEPGQLNLTLIAERKGEIIVHEWMVTVLTDTTPPLLFFVPPTPLNGSYIRSDRITINVSSSETAENATLYYDGQQFMVNGQRRNWQITIITGPEGAHSFYFTATDNHGNQGRTGVIVITADRTKPSIKLTQNNLTVENIGRKAYLVAERLSQASIDIIFRDNNPDVFDVQILKNTPSSIRSPILLSPGEYVYQNKRYVDGARYTVRIDTRKTGNITVRISVLDKAGNEASATLPIIIRDTTPPGTPSNITVRLAPFKATITWASPADGDFSHTIVYLDPPCIEKEVEEKGEKKITKQWLLENSTSYTVYSKPEMENRLILNLTAGIHTVFLQSVDTYGNKGEPVEQVFEVPLPTLILNFVPPTPNNNTERQPDETMFEVKVNSTVPLRNATLMLNNVSYQMKIENNTASLPRLELIPGVQYRYKAIVADIYGRENTTDERLLVVQPQIFIDGSTLKILYNGGPTGSLYFHPTILLYSNTMPKNIYLKATLGDATIQSRVTPTIIGSTRIAPREKTPVSHLYNISLRIPVNLWGLQKTADEILGSNRPLIVQIEVIAEDPAGNIIEDSKEITICNNPSQISFMTDIKSEYNEGDHQSLHFYTPRGINASGFLIKVNTQHPQPIANGTILTKYLEKGENTVTLIMNSTCGRLIIEKHSVFMGPPVEGDWVINTTVKAVNRVIHVNGDLIITSEGSLSLSYSTIEAHNMESQGMFKAFKSTVALADSINSSWSTMEIQGSSLNTRKMFLLDTPLLLEDSHVTGNIQSIGANTTIINTIIKGTVSLSGDVEITGTLVEGENGLLITSSEGLLDIYNLTIVSPHNGLTITNYTALHGSGIRNVTIKGAMTGIELYYGLPGLSIPTILLEGLDLEDNRIGIKIAGYSAAINNTSILNNELYGLEIIGAGTDSYAIVENSVIKGNSAILAKNIGSLILNNTSIQGRVITEKAPIYMTVPENSRTTLAYGSMFNADIDVFGTLTIRSFHLGNTSFLITGDIKIVDTDGIPATSPIDNDASVIEDSTILQQVSSNSSSSMSFLNSILDNTVISSDTRWLLIRGSIMKGGELILKTMESGEHLETSTENPIYHGIPWYYVKDPGTIPSSTWLRSNSTQGMMRAGTPVLGLSGLKSLPEFHNGTIVGSFKDIYLKRTFNITRLPLEAELELTFSGTIEVYVNGLKVYHDDTPLQLTLSSGRIAPIIKNKNIDIAPYLFPGENIITVHESLPSSIPYRMMGVFDSELSLITGVSGISNSIIEAPIKGYATRAFMRNVTVKGDLDFSYYSSIEMKDSLIIGTVNILGRISIMNTALEGNGEGIGVNTLPNYGEVVVEDSRITGYSIGVQANNNVTVKTSDIHNNTIGIRIENSNVTLISNYIRDNGLGLQLSNARGLVENNIFSNNNIGAHISYNTLSSLYSSRHLYIDHNTFLANTIGLSLTSDGTANAQASFTHNIVQGNSLGIQMNKKFPVYFDGNLLENDRSVYIEGGNADYFHNTDWGHDTKRVANYTGGLMYTETGEYDSEHYDVLDKTWQFIYSYRAASSDYGSNLLSAYLEVFPMENGSARGEITLYGKGYSKSGLSSVKYTLNYNGRVFLLGVIPVNGKTYDSYISLDTVSRNLTGEGRLGITVTDRDGRSLSFTRKVYFSNSEIRIVSYNITNPRSIYVYRRDPNYYTGVIPYKQRFANITMKLKNTGTIPSMATVEIKLPEYIERHTGRIKAVVGLPGNESGILYVAFPLTVYYPTKLKWDPLPDELPSDHKIPVEITIYDKDNIPRQTIKTNISFTLGPVFEIKKYNAYVYTKHYCNTLGNCHPKYFGGTLVYTYDGDGDSLLEAAESHHFDIYIENVGDEPAYMKGLIIQESILLFNSTAGKGVKKFMSNTINIPFPPSKTEAWLADSHDSFMPTIIDPGETIKINGGWMPWWPDDPPLLIPPVNYTGYYLESARIIYYPMLQGAVKTDGYLVTATVNHEKVGVKALNKEFQSFSKMIGPIKVSVLGINGNLTIMKMENTNDNVYYSYYAEGSFDTDRKGYIWYHVIPPGFDFLVKVPKSRMPNTVIPHYSVDVGFETSLLFNEIELGAIGLQGALGAMDIDVPIQTIISALVKTLLKITNIVEFISIPDDIQSMSELQNTTKGSEINSELQNSEEIIVPLTVESFSRWEKNYGMDPAFYRDLQNFENLPVSRQAEIVLTIGKAIVTDEDLQVLFLETLIELIDNDIANDIYEMVKSVKDQPTPQEELGNSLDKINEQIRKEMVRIIKDEVKKQKSFKSMSPKEQKKALKKVGEETAATLEAFEQMGEWAFYNIYAMLTQPLPQTIQVLDPPGNYTVEATEPDTALIIGGEQGDADGWGNVTLMLGNPDTYRANYIVPTSETRLDGIMENMFSDISILIIGNKTMSGLQGSITVTMIPTPDKAEIAKRIFREELFARAILSSFMLSLESSKTVILDNKIVLEADGTVPGIKGDQNVIINVTADKNLTRAVIERKGNYSGVLYLKPSFGIKPENIEVTLKRNETSTVTSMEKTGISVSSQVLPIPPNITVYPKKIMKDGVFTIFVDKPYLTGWRIGNKTGEGNIVSAKGLPPGNYTLEVMVEYGSRHINKSFQVEIIPRKTVKTGIEGAFVKAAKGELVRINTGTDLYKLYFIAKDDINGTVVVQQLGEKNMTMDNNRYVFYSVFNITHPDWAYSNVTVRLRIPVTWFDAHNVTTEDIMMYRIIGGNITEIHLIKEGRGLRYQYYLANLPGLSCYAVGYKIPVQHTNKTATNESGEAMPTRTTSHAQSENSAAQPTKTVSTTSIVIATISLIIISIGVLITFQRLGRKA